MEVLTREEESRAPLSHNPKRSVESLVTKKDVPISAPKWGEDDSDDGTQIYMVVVVVVFKKWLPTMVLKFDARKRKDLSCVEERTDEGPLNFYHGIVLSP